MQWLQILNNKTFYVTSKKKISSNATNQEFNPKKYTMGGEVIIVGLVFGSIFGVFYLYFSTRNKERLALIEKGAEASIFVSGGRKTHLPFWKIFIPTLALVLVGVGIAIFIGSALVNSLGMDEDVAFPATIFTMAGIGLFVGFTLTKKMDKE